MCADQEAGVVLARSCVCTRAGSLDLATGSCVCEHARRTAGSLPPDVAPARSLATGKALKPARKVSLFAEDPHAETLATEASSDGHPFAQVFAEGRERELERDGGAAEARPRPGHSHQGGVGGVGGVTQGSSSSVRSRNDFTVDVKVPLSPPPSPPQPPKPEPPWPPTTDPQTPKHVLQDCAAWALLGECTSNPMFMWSWCASSCRA